MALLDTLTTSAIDLAIQTGQLGTLTDPDKLPTHESYYITLQLWALSAETGMRVAPLMTHSFTVLPRSMRSALRYVPNILMTPAGAQVDDYAMPDKFVVMPFQIVLQGNFGHRARVFITDNSEASFDGALSQLARELSDKSFPQLPVGLITGYGQTKYLERLCNASHQPISQAVKIRYGDQTLVPELVLYNWAFHQFLRVTVNSCPISRDASLNLWSYQLNMTALGSLSSGFEAQSARVHAFAQLTRGILQRTAQAGIDAATRLVNSPALSNSGERSGTASTASPSRSVVEYDGAPGEAAVPDPPSDSFGYANAATPVLP